MKVKLALKKLDYYSNEAYNTLRTNIQFCGGDKRVIEFTSCMPNEGKSSVTLNLAVSMAESGKSVLLIDADLRKSVLKARVRLQERVDGLTHYLTGQASVEEIICTTDIPQLHMIFAGPVPPNPSELLNSSLFEELISEQRKKYEYIIIDTPPLGSVIDSAIIARVCDGTIMVVETDAVSYKLAQEVKEQMIKTGCPILGVVLNKVDISKRSYSGKYKKYRKYKEYKNRG